MIYLTLLLLGLLSLIISTVVFIIQNMRARRWNADRLARYQQEHNRSVDDLILRLQTLHKAFTLVAIGSAVSTVCMGISAVAIYLIYGKQFGSLLFVMAATFFLISASMLLNRWAFNVELSRIRELQKPDKTN